MKALAEKGIKELLGLEGASDKEKSSWEQGDLEG